MWGPRARRTRHPGGLAVTEPYGSVYGSGGTHARGAGAASSTVLIAAALSTEWTDLLQGLLEYPPHVGDLRRAPVATTARAAAHPMPAAPMQIRTQTAARSCAWRMTRRLTRGDLPAGRPTNDLRKALLIGSAPPCAAGPGAAGRTATGRLTMCASAARRGEVAALLKPMKRGGRASRASTAAGAGRTAHLATGGVPPLCGTSWRSCGHIALQHDSGILVKRGQAVHGDGSPATRITATRP